MLKVNDLVQCQPNGNLKRSFIGQIEKIYERSIMVKIIDHHIEDRWKVIELTGRVIVRMQSVALVPAIAES
ncbi:hypothetical protein [Secundilactobacillus collinoides]|uniref:KOW domain-containing protein n=1 Tax=Secundilactobacillus collinoides TaxID=33960 RepID=A0A166HB33_SECCO|nr:hypothetical protein [Secundilactobacillus collinoides]KZL41780.1 hypothetical protein TY91_05140 [Secundilactobacillus collinoides]